MIPTGSIVDLTIETRRSASIDEINSLFRERADVGEFAGILAYSEEPLVPSDIVKSPHSRNLSSSGSADALVRKWGSGLYQGRQAVRELQEHAGRIETADPESCCASSVDPNLAAAVFDAGDVIQWDCQIRRSVAGEEGV